KALELDSTLAHPMPELACQSCSIFNDLNDLRCRKSIFYQGATGGARSLGGALPAFVFRKNNSLRKPERNSLIHLIFAVEVSYLGTGFGTVAGPSLSCK